MQGPADAPAKSLIPLPVNMLETVHKTNKGNNYREKKREEKGRAGSEAEWRIFSCKRPQMLSHGRLVVEPEIVTGPSYSGIRLMRPCTRSPERNATLAQRKRSHPNHLIAYSIGNVLYAQLISVMAVTSLR